MKLTLYKNDEDLILKLNSLVVALMLAAGAITSTLARIPLFANIQNNVVVLGISAFIIFTEILKSKKICLPIPAIITLILVIVWYAYSIIFHGSDCDLTYIQFIFYAILPIYAVSQKIDGEYVMRYTLYLSLVSIFTSSSFFAIQYDQYSQAFMGNIYPLLTPVTVAMIHFKLYRKQANIVVILAYVYNLYLFVKMIFFANRGAVMCLLFCLMVLLINSYDEDVRKKLSGLKILLIVIFCFIGLIIIINALPLLEGFSQWMQETFNSVPSFVTKMIKYLRDGDVTDGRTTINSFTLNEIANHPFFGHGIKTFESVSSRVIGKPLVYPHQYIYQYLFEGGIFFSIIPIFLSITITLKVLFARIDNKKEFAICCTLVCACIPKLLVSTDPWASTVIWMMITYSLIYTFNNNSYFIKRKDKKAYK